ncbi:MAG: discoidin domain-containing protein [Paludibacter sp.]|jgi:hypothetical protein|nr:discoidin domain-containing protein [Paludibacter sp.]
MKKLLLINIAIFCLSQLSATDLVPKTPSNGIGKQYVSVYAHSGQVVGTSNLAFNLLYNNLDLNSSKRWYNNSNWFPWVIFEFTDTYSIDKIEFRDVGTVSENYANVQEYSVYVSSENPMNCQWRKVYSGVDEGDIDIKKIELNDVDSVRFVKLVCSPGMKSDNTWDNGVRIYGLDIYGEISEKIERESVSVGKTVLAFNANSSYYNSPLNLLDGNTTNVESLWYTNRPRPTDSLSWVVIDLENNYNINKFRLHDARTLIPDGSNLMGYNVYVSPDLPDISKIGANIDENTCWTKIIDAYAEDRTDVDVKVDDLIANGVRYVKLEVPRSRTTGLIQIYQFEVFGQEVPSLVQNVVKENGFSLNTNFLRKNNSLIMSSDKNGVVRVYNLQGVMVYEDYFVGESQTITMNYITPGVYVVNFNNENQKLIVE